MSQNSGNRTGRPRRITWQGCLEALADPTEERVIRLIKAATVVFVLAIGAEYAFYLYIGSSISNDIRQDQAITQKIISSHFKHPLGHHEI